MFIRAKETINKTTGAIYTKHQLVESIRTENGPRQRIVMDLGSLNLDKSKWPQLAKAIALKLSNSPTLFKFDSEIEKLSSDAVSHFDFIKTDSEDKSVRKDESLYKEIDLNSTSVTSVKSLGNELVALSFMEKLKLDEILENLNLKKRQVNLAKAVIAARLIKPGSDLAAFNFIKENSSLAEILDLDDLKKDEIYDIADTLLINKSFIEKNLNEHQNLLFSHDRSILLYDLTNTYFEGKASSNKLAKYGRSKEKRSDCLLVTLALVVDKLGLPIYSKIYSGNQSEPVTLKDILEELDKYSNTLFDSIKPTVIFDRGIATKENLELLSTRCYPYIVVERSQGKGEYLEEFKDESSFTKIKRDDTQDSTDQDSNTQDIEVLVKKVNSTDKVTKILAISKGRRLKEAAIDEKKETGYKNEINTIASLIEKGRLVDTEKIMLRLGRLQQKYSGISHHYEITITKKDEKITGLNILKLKSKSDKESLYGCYIITTTHTDLSAEAIWKLYMTLTKVENAFKSLKTDLGLRPIYHQLAKRTEAHLFISVLAYYLLSAIELQLRNNNDSRTFNTIKETLDTHIRCTIMVTDKDSNIYHIRTSSVAEPKHTQIYDILNVKDITRRKTRLIGHL